MQAGRGTVRTHYKVGICLRLLPETDSDKLPGLEAVKPLISQTGKLSPGGKGFGIVQAAKDRKSVV